MAEYLVVVEESDGSDERTIEIGELNLRRQTLAIMGPGPRAVAIELNALEDGSLVVRVSEDGYSLDSYVFDRTKFTIDAMNEEPRRVRS